MTAGSPPGAVGSVHVAQVGAGVVIRPVFDPQPRSVESITDEQFESAFDSPMRNTVTAARAAVAAGARRIVVVVPVTAMGGGSHYAHTAMAAEGVRLLVKSAARQWGGRGVTVNAVAVSPEGVLADPELAGPSSLAPPALTGRDPEALIAFLCSDAGGDVTGQTIVVDGGVWM